MAKGTLDPAIYSSYMIQDIVYLRHVFKKYEEASGTFKVQGNKEFAQFFLERARRYEKDYLQSLERFQLKSDACVKTGPAVQMYMDYQKGVVLDNPKYLPIATLSCGMLWPWMAGNLIGKVDPQNPYKQWFVMNVREPGQQGTTELFVDKHFTKEDEAKALHIFCVGLIMEANFFREAGGEELFISPDEICRNLMSSLHK